MLAQSKYRAREYELAYSAREWNVAVRHAQEVTEQAVKAAVLLTGTKNVMGHDDEAARQLKNILEQQLHLALSGRPEMARRIQDANTYYGLEQRSSELRIWKNVSGVRTLLGKCSVLHQDRIIDFEVDGSSIVVKNGRNRLIEVTDTSLSLGFPEDWHFPLKLSVQEWQQLFTGCRSLGNMRERSFYAVNNCSEADARQAGEAMRSVVRLTKTLLP